MARSCDGRPVHEAGHRQHRGRPRVIIAADHLVGAAGCPSHPGPGAQQPQRVDPPGIEGRRAPAEHGGAHIRYSSSTSPAASSSFQSVRLWNTRMSSPGWSLSSATACRASARVAGWSWSGSSARCRLSDGVGNDDLPDLVVAPADLSEEVGDIRVGDHPNGHLGGLGYRRPVSLEPRIRRRAEQQRVGAPQALEVLLVRAAACRCSAGTRGSARQRSLSIGRAMTSRPGPSKQPSSDGAQTPPGGPLSCDAPTPAIS
jgi:hypothetical protein